MKNNELVVSIKRRLNSAQAFMLDIDKGQNDILQNKANMDWAYGPKRFMRVAGMNHRRLMLLHYYYMWDWKTARLMWGKADGTILGKTVYRVYLFTAFCSLGDQHHVFDFALLTYAKTTGVGSEICLLRSVKDAPVDFVPYVIRQLASLRRSIKTR